MSDKKRKDLVRWYLKKQEQEMYAREKKKAEELFDKIITHRQIREASRDRSFS